MKNLLELTKIILVEPSGPLNVGSIARLCQNFGVESLNIVNPQCNIKDSEALRMAVKGKSFLHNANIFSSLIEAIEDCNLIIATSGRIENGDLTFTTLKQTKEWLKELKINKKIALIFGRENRGLTNQELTFAHKIINLNTNESYASLNLSHSVAIVLHEISLLNDKPRNYNDHSDPIENTKIINDFLIDAEELLLDIGFLLKHTAKPRMAKIRRLIQRAEIRSEEVSLIRGVLRQMRWAIYNKNQEAPKN